MKRIGDFFFPCGKHLCFKALGLFERDDPIGVVDPQHTIGSSLCFFAHVDTTNSDLGIPHQRIQFVLQLCLLLLHGTMHTTQAGEDTFNLTQGGMYLFLRLADLI